jgi:hypothetical protein
MESRGMQSKKCVGGCHHRESKPNRAKASIGKAHNKSKLFSGSMRRGEQEAITEIPSTLRIMGQHSYAPSLDKEEMEKQLKENVPT